MQPFNKYYPKDFDPSKHNSVNQHVGSHPLGHRARKLKSEGILIIRFELPFNIWCLGCDNHIGRGVRFNAEKKKVGNYYSTPIWSFRMKCHLCDNWFEIQTDPKNTQYTVIEGARKKVEDFDPEDIGIIAMTDEKTSEKMENDPLYRLDKSLQDEIKAKEEHEFFEKLIDSNNHQWQDPFTRNQHLRKKFRHDKKERIELQRECNKIAARIGTTIPILPESSQDQSLASEQILKNQDPLLRQQIEFKRQKVMHESIFASVSSKLPRVGSSKVSKSTSFLKPSKRSVLSKRILSFQPKGSVFDASFKSTKQ